MAEIKNLSLQDQRNILLPKGVILITGEFNSALFDYAFESLRILRLQEVKNVTLEITSGGGDGWVGRGLADEVINYPGEVTGIVRGRAESMAAFLLQACHVRQMFPGTRLVFHYTYSQKTSAFYGEDYDLETHLDNLKSSQKSITEYCLKRAKMSAEEWHKLLIADRPVYADEALRLGLIDEIRRAAWLYGVKKETELF